MKALDTIEGAPHMIKGGQIWGRHHYKGALMHLRGRYYNLERRHMKVNARFGGALKFRGAPIII